MLDGVDTADAELAWMLEDESKGWMRFDGMVDPDVTYSLCCLICRQTYARRVEDPADHEIVGWWLTGIATHHLPCVVL